MNKFDYTEMKQFADKAGYRSAYNILLFGGPDSYEGDYDEYSILLKYFEVKSQREELNAAI